MLYSKEVRIISLLTGFFLIANVVGGAWAIQVTVVSPTPSNGTISRNISFIINTSISESNLSEAIYNWNGTNFTMYNDSLVLIFNFDNVTVIGDNYSIGPGNKSVDISKYGNNATINGATWNATGKYGGAFNFNGAGDYLKIQDNPSLDAQQKMTFSAWIYPESYGDAADAYIKTILNDDNGTSLTATWRLGSKGSAALKAKLGLNFNDGSNNDVESAGDVPLNTWTYVAVVTNGTNANFYFNGILNSSTSYSITPTQTAHNWYIGAHLDSGGSFSREFDGKIDELRLWNRSLSADEVYQQYISNLNKFNSTQWYLYVNQSKNATGGLDDGKYTYQTFAMDSIGNVSSTGLRTLTVDTTLPQIFTNITNTTYGLANLTAQLNVSDANPDRVWVSLDGGSNSSAVLPNATTSLSSLTDGQHNLTIFANDTADNLNSSTVRFTIDTSVPNPVSHNVSNTSYASASMTVSLNASDPNLDNLWFQNSSGNSSLLSANGTIGVMWSEGHRWILVWANDTLGNLNKSNNVSFTIDTTDPLIFTNITNTTYGVSALTVQLNSSDANPDKIWYSLNGIGNSSFVTPNTTVSLSGLSDGQNNVTIYVNDTAGNMNFTTVYFTIDTVGPAINTPSSSGGGEPYTGRASSAKILLLANSIDSAMSDKFLELLRISDISTTPIGPGSFNEFMRVDNRLIVILGGPDAPGGIGEIVRGILNESEQEAIRNSDNPLVFIKFNVYTQRYTHYQRVIILAGSNRQKTSKAGMENREKVETTILD